MTPRSGAGRELDHSLVTAWLGGDREAFDALWARWNPAFTRHAARLLSPDDTARDAVQDAWPDILTGLPRLEDRGLFGVWAMRIVTRKCQRRLRLRYRDRETAAAARAEAAVARAPTTDASIVATDLRAALRALPPAQLAAMELFYLEDFSVAEIAVALGVPAGTVKTRLMHGRRRIQDMMTGDCDD